MILLTVYICVRSCVAMPEGYYHSFRHCHEAAHQYQLKQEIQGWTCKEIASG